jgi:flagellar assembly factor FliW
MPTVLVASSRLGELELSDDSIVQFPQGLLGFEPFHAYALIDHDGAGVYWWLQSLDDRELAFLAVVPWPFFPDYEPEIDAEAEAALGLEDAADALVLCLVAVRDPDESTNGPSISANLLGPVVVNQRTRVGAQVVLHDGTWPVRADLVGG